MVYEPRNTIFYFWQLCGCLGECIYSMIYWCLFPHMPNYIIFTFTSIFSPFTFTFMCYIYMKYIFCTFIFIYIFRRYWCSTRHVKPLSRGRYFIFRCTYTYGSGKQNYYIYRPLIRCFLHVLKLTTSIILWVSCSPGSNDLSSVIQS